MRALRAPGVHRLLGAPVRSPLTTAAPVIRAAELLRTGLYDSTGGSRSFLTTTVARSGMKDILEEEISHEKNNYTPPEGANAGPPKPWKVTEEEGSALVTLQRTYGSETVKVELLVNNQENDEAEEEVNEDDEDLAAGGSGLAFNATVTKGDKALVFECRTDGTYVEILHVSLLPADENADIDTVYDGPVYQELDERLQEQFDRYLEERGVDAAVGGYLLGLSEDKEQREYMAWLTNVKKFVADK